MYLGLLSKGLLVVKNKAVSKIPQKNKIMFQRYNENLKEMGGTKEKTKKDDCLWATCTCLFFLFPEVSVAFSSLYH